MGMPSPRVRTVLELLDEMSAGEREELRDELEGVCGPQEWKRAWNEEIASRIARIEKGEVELVDGEDVLGELREDMRE
jgi:hypothetical protein